MSWKFLHPSRLWLLLLIVGFAGLYVLAQLRRRKRAVRFTNIELLDVVAPHRPSWRRPLVSGIMLIGFTVGVVGFAQPYRTERVATDRSIIMVTLDVSLSMLADDVDPSRFEAAKAQAKEFIEQVDDSIDVGLVTFSFDVRVRVAPTLDHRKVIDAIDRISLDQGTAIGDAIITAADTIANELEDTDTATDNQDATDSTVPIDSGPIPLGDGSTTPAAIVILTDGETIEGRTPGQEGAKRAAAYGIPVYGIVFGTPGGTVTLDNPETGLQETTPVPVKYEELEQAAEITGGASYKAESDTALADAYDDIAQRLTALEVPEPKRVDLALRYLAVAFALLAIAVALGLWWLGGIT